MKKVFKLISLALFGVIMFTGCSCSKGENINKTTIEKASSKVNTYEVLTSSKLQTKLDNKDTFLLYVKNKYCGGCKKFNPVLDKLIPELQLKIYAIEDTTFTSSKFGNITSTPTMIIYSKGVNKYQLDFSKNENYFTSEKGFKDFLNKYVNLINASESNVEETISKVEINKSKEQVTTYKSIDSVKLNELITNKSNFILYLKAKVCSNCKVFEPFLNESISANQIDIYEINIEEYNKFDLVNIEISPSIVIFNKGEVLITVDSYKNQQYFVSLNGFNSLLNKYITIVDTKE